MSDNEFHDSTDCSRATGEPERLTRAVPGAPSLKFRRIVDDWLWKNGQHQDGWQKSQINDMARMLEHFESKHRTKQEAE